MARLARALSKHCFRTVLAVNELLVLRFEGARLVLRVAAANTLDAEAREVRRGGPSMYPKTWVKL